MLPELNQYGDLDTSHLGKRKPHGRKVRFKERVRPKCERSPGIRESVHRKAIEESDNLHFLDYSKVGRITELCF